MTALKIQVTNAGRAALVNAQNTGTLPVTVATVGVTDQAFTPDAALTELPGQLKQLATFAGSAVAADTIHVIIRDDSADTYSLRGFGLRLADGTLFAVYGQADAILEKSAQAMMLLATDVIFEDIDATSLTFGDTNFLNPPATTEVQGVVEMATDSESIAGTDPLRAMSPKGLMAVLNARFGAGNPSSFVKGLLDKVSSLAFVTALGIRGAASYDTGTGNGLDADLLDGQHGAYYRAWGNLTGVPATFTPAAHQHSAADITSGTLPVARGGTGAGTFVAGNYVVGNGAAALGSKTPAEVLADIGAAPSAHSHAISAVNGLQSALDAKAPLLSPTLSGTPTAPTAAAGANNTQIANTAFVQQLIANLINGSPGALDTLKELADAMGDDPNFAATVTNALAGKAPLDLVQGAGIGSGAGQSLADWNAAPGVPAFVSALGGSANTPSAGGGIGINVTRNGNTSAQLAMSYAVDGMFFRRQNGGVWSPWREVWHTGNFDPTTKLNADQMISGGFGQGSQYTGFKGSQATDANYSFLFSRAGTQSIINATSLVRLAIGGAGILDVGSSGATVTGLLTATTANFTASDRRLKYEIAPAEARPLHRSVPFCSFRRRADSSHGRGPVAQDLLEHEPTYVSEFDTHEGKRLSVDYAGYALEVGTWAAHEVDRLSILVGKLTARISSLEHRA